MKKFRFIFFLMVLCLLVIGKWEYSFAQDSIYLDLTESMSESGDDSVMDFCDEYLIDDYSANSLDTIWEVDNSLVLEGDGNEIIIEDSDANSNYLTGLSYTVKYLGNGATKGKARTYKLFENEEHSIIDNYYVKKGYSFLGWNTKKNGTGVMYKAGQVVNNLSAINKSVVNLYAQWGIITYNITYHLLADIDSIYPERFKDSAVVPTTYNVITKTFKLPKPIKTGFSFKGFFKDSSLKRQVTQIKKGSVGDYELYPKWSPNKYTLKFVKNGATKGKMSNKCYKYNVSYDLPQCSYIRKGYSFAGYSLDAEGENMLPATIDGSYFGDIKNNATIKVYAQWKKDNSNLCKQTRISEDSYEYVYYVDGAYGNDNNDGFTKQTAFRTINKALEVAGENDTVYVRATDGYSGNIYNSAENTGNQICYKEKVRFIHSGSKYNYLSVKGGWPAEDGTWPASDSLKPKVSYNGEDEIEVIDTNGQSYINIINLEIADIHCVEAVGIYIGSNVKHVNIKSCSIHDIETTKAYNYLDKEKTIVDENNPGEGSANAILMLGEGKKSANSIAYINVENCRIYNLKTGWSEAVSVASNCEYVTVTNCVIHDVLNIGIDFYGNGKYCKVASLDQPRYCKAIANEVYNCHSPYAYCAGIYVDGARNTTLADNYVHNCDYGIEIGAERLSSKYPTRTIDILRNHIYHNERGGLRIGGYDEKYSGNVVSCLIGENIIYDNDPGYEAFDEEYGKYIEYFGEIHLAKCTKVTITDNKIGKSSDYAGGLMICNEMAEKYTTKLSFKNNTYYSPLGADKLHFFMYRNKEIEGLTAFNRLINGNDIFDDWGLDN